uniref:Uncharacterized protein n=1 Tax=viral metagenome TaxID=1070528 RepID=A0A6C0JDX5_9ZZZZ
MEQFREEFLYFLDNYDVKKLIDKPMLKMNSYKSYVLKHIDHENISEIISKTFDVERIVLKIYLIHNYNNFLTNYFVLDDAINKNIVKRTENIKIDVPDIPIDLIVEPRLTKEEFSLIHTTIVVYQQDIDKIKEIVGEKKYNIFKSDSEFYYKTYPREIERATMRGVKQLSG